MIVRKDIVLLFGFELLHERDERWVSLAGRHGKFHLQD
jgi:hypothetical protein